MKSPLISIIVPVYKVEKYLCKCLDSILAQTYTNLEIILVDDGSPDRSGVICDEYAVKDDRVTVIHQKNKGLSGARNSALDVATGDYIGFVDSDDWIEHDMYEYLLTNAINFDADISFCGRIEEYPTRAVGKSWPYTEVMETHEALKNLLEDKILHNGVWDKLWKRELFESIRFPEGMTFEDMAVVHLLFINARRVVLLPEQKYHYLQREGSIVADTSIANRINFYLAARKRYDEMIDGWPEFKQLLETQCLATTVNIWSGYGFSPLDMRKQYAQHLNEISSFAKPRVKSYRHKTNLGLAGRLILTLVPYKTWWAFAVSGMIGWMYKIKNGRVL